MMQENENRITNLQNLLNKSILDDPFEKVMDDLDYTRNFAMKNILKTQKRQSPAIILKRVVTGNIRMVILQMVSHTVDLD